MRIPIFSQGSNIVKAITQKFLTEIAPRPRHKAREKPSTLTNGPRPNCGSVIPVWRPPKIPAVLSQLFQKLKSVVSAFYNALLVYQNGRACITKFRRLLI